MTAPRIKFRVLPKFPARVEEGPGLAVEKEDGIWTLGLKFSDLAEQASFDDDTEAKFVFAVPGDEEGEETFYVITPANFYALVRTYAATLPVQLPEYTVATQPDATEYEGALIYVSDGAEGSPTVAWSNGTIWIEDDGTEIDAGAGSTWDSDLVSALV